jgi:sarcosine oxidase
MERADVVVIGAGAMGSATAWWLARLGADVVLLEQFPQGHALGSSHGGSRIFRFAYPDPHYVRLAQEALPLWRELEDDAGEPLLDITGAVDHGDPSSVELITSTLASCGGAHERLTADAAHERWPGMRFEGPVLYHPDGGRCRADAAVRALQDRAAAHGADVRFATGAASLAVIVGGDAVEVRAPELDEVWHARVAVVTAGGWVRSVLEGTEAAGVLPPITVTQEQVQHFAPRHEGQGDDSLAWPSFIHHRQPWTYGLLTPGEGVKVAEHHVGAVIDADHRVPRDPRAEATIVRYVEQWFPGLDPAPVHTAECLYTTTPDESFVLERVGPVVVGSPCSGHGFKFTPAIGRRIAKMAGW